MTQPDVTAMLSDSQRGDERAGDALLEAVYDRLRRLAEQKLRQERAGHTLQATALVHEAYLKLVDQTRVDWQGQTHFYAVAARAMQRLLVDYARGRKREKRGGDHGPVTLHDVHALTEADHLDSIALQEAMEEMRAVDERQANVAELRLYGGLSIDDTARMLDLPKRTVERDWKMARAWLRHQLRKASD